MFAKDVRRFCPHLCALFTVVGGHAWGLRPNDGMPIPIPIGVVPLALAILAALVVHADKPSGSRAFWATRPHGAGAVLAAKLAFAGLFLLAIPVFIEAVWFRSLGAGPELPRLVADSAVFAAALLASAMAVAALTSTLRGVLATALGIWAVLSIYKTIVAPEVAGLWWDRAGVSATQSYLNQWAAIATGLAIVSHQYLTRHTRRSAFIGATALLCLVPGIQRIQLDWADIPDRTDTLERFPFEGDRAMVVRDANLQRGSLRGPGLEALSTISMRMEVDEGPEVALLPTSVRTVVGERSFLTDPTSDPMTLRMSRSVAIFAVPDIDRVGQDPSRPPRPVIGDVPIVSANSGEELEAQLGAGPVQSTWSFDAYRTEPLARLEARPGSSTEASGYELTVLAARRIGESLQVDLRGRWTATSTLRRNSPYAGDVFDRLGLVLLSNQYLDYLPNMNGNGGWQRTYTLLGAAHLSEHLTAIGFDGDFLRQRRNPSRLPGDWFDDVELVVLGSRYAGSFEKTFSWDMPEWPTLSGFVRVDEVDVRD